MNKRLRNFNGITLVALVVTIVILLILAGIAIATLGGENGLLAKTKQAKKNHIQSEMLEQLTLALNELQVDKKVNASLDDVTQEWISSAISNDYNPIIKEDASLDGKMVVMKKSDVTGKFLISQNLEISKTEYNVGALEFEYETGKLESGKVKILIKITDKVNGITQIDYPDLSEKPLIMNNRKEPVGIDYSVELGKEYKFVITTGDGNKTEKIIKIDDYFYNITKNFGEGVIIDNNITKISYNKTYKATISTLYTCYEITDFMVTIGGQEATTLGNNIVDINTGKISIERVTGDININVITKFDKDKLKDNIKINPSTTDWTNSNIQVDVEWGYDNDNIKKEISTDNGITYNNYVGKFEIEKNTTIIARLTIDNEEVKKELKITNIDKLEPKKFTPIVSDNVSSTELVISANAIDAEATEEYGYSGIKGYKYFVFQDEKEVFISQLITTTSLNVSNLIAGKEYCIYIQAYDYAENIVESERINHTKLDVYKWNKYNVNLTTEYYYEEGREVTITYKYGYVHTTTLNAFNKNTGKWRCSGSSNTRTPNVGEYLGTILPNSISNYETTTIYRVTNARFSSLKYIVTGIEYKSKEKKTYLKGTKLYGTVTGSKIDEYPDNGYKDEYWYVKVNN